MKMNIRINGNVEQIDAGQSVLAFIEKKGFNAKAVIVEHNGQIIARDAWPAVTLKGADTLEIVSFVGGG